MESCARAVLPFSSLYGCKRRARSPRLSGERTRLACRVRRPRRTHLGNECIIGLANGFPARAPERAREARALPGDSRNGVGCLNWKLDVEPASAQLLRPNDRSL